MELVINDVNFTVKMGWSFVSIGIASKKEKYVFPIEQMVGEPDILYVPNSDSALLTKEEVVTSLSNVKWNRDIRTIESEGNLSPIDIHEKEFHVGSLESTKAGEEFLEM